MTDLRGSGPLTPRYERAFSLAADIHRDQPRKGSRVAYLSHLMSVSALVLEDGGTEDEAIAALLHDAVEDGPPTSRVAIETGFGPVVLDMVLSCTDDEPDDDGVKRPWSTRKQEYLAHLPHASLGSLRVTAADKLHNARCIAADLRVDDTWPKSNACVHQHLWYYASVYDAVQPRLPGSRTVTGLDRAVDELCALVRLPRPSASPVAPSCSCPVTRSRRASPAPSA